MAYKNLQAVFLEQEAEQMIIKLQGNSFPPVGSNMITNNAEEIKCRQISFHYAPLKSIQFLVVKKGEIEVFSYPNFETDFTFPQ
jgi:hypothetical protein